MSVNRYSAHMAIVPEDDAYRQIVNGFIRGFPDDVQRRLQPYPPAGGWAKALARIDPQELSKFPGRLLVILIDFDSDIEERGRKIEEARARAGAAGDRVFVIGANPEAEDLAREMHMTLARCGRQCADDCGVRRHGLLRLQAFRHNAGVFETLAARFHSDILCDRSGG